MDHPVPPSLRIPRPPRVGRLTAYLLALIIPAVTCAVQYALVPTVQLVPFILFFLTAFLASWFGGRGPGLLAMAVSALLANYFFLGPLGFSFEGREMVLTVLYLVVSAVVTALSASVREGYAEQDRLLTEARQAHAGLAEANARLRVLAESAVVLSSLPSWEETVEAVSRMGLHRFADSVALDLEPQPAKEAAQGTCESSVDGTPRLTLPLHARGTVIGRMIFERRPPRRPFDADDLLLADELARRASMALENARLFRASQEAIRLRDDFLAVAGHELKTPLTALRLQVSALQRRPHELAGLDAKTHERLQRAARSVERLSMLVDELLDVSRITAGRLKLERSAVDLSEVVAEHVRSAQEGPTSPACTFTLSAEPNVVGHWDRLRIDQIVGNLLSNALKYGQGKEIAVSVSASKGCARLVVRDQGMGISPADQSRIFERFERAVPDHHYGGLGLGLWIVRQVVEAHGGAIAVESTEGAGATFVVELPLGDSQAGPLSAA